LIVIDLPMPPSVNAIWCHGRGRTWLDPKYASWKREADQEAMASRVLVGIKPIDGPFRANIAINYQMVRKNSDIDNKIKAVLDFAQKAGIVTNDKNCVRVEAHYGDAPKGCRLTVTPA
jgi:Holliday junction resolvase RusA-like endonuclease